MLLSLPSLRGRPRRTLYLATALVAGLAAPLALPAASFAAGAPPVMLMAQNTRDAAQLTLRIQALEQQVRDLTGQVQGLQFQLTQLQTLLDRSNQDNDFRFKALEGGNGGAPGKTDAVEQSGSVTPPSSSSQRPGTQRPHADAPQSHELRTNEQPTPVGGNAGGTDAAGSDALLGVGVGDDLGPSADPLVGKGNGADGLEVLPLGPARAGFDNSGQTRPVTLTPAPAGNADAAAQYKAAYDALVKGNFSFAADQFRQYVKLYPHEAQAADATNWLGEALLQQRDYVDAADVLVTGYKSYPDSPRAPDMLLRLGTALAGANQPEASCKTFGLLAQKYPDTTGAFKTRLKQEMAKGKCPG